MADKLLKKRIPINDNTIFIYLAFKSLSAIFLKWKLPVDDLDKSILVIIQ